MPIVSFSELDTLRQCPFKHQLAYRERWVPTKDALALDRGKRLHTLLEDWYTAIQQGTNPTTRDIMEASGVIYTENGDYLDDTAELLEWMFNGYAENYGYDPEWKVTSVEHDFVQPLPKPDGKPSTYKLKGKIDLIAEWRGRLWVIDHKTAARLPTDKELDLDVQFGLYAWAMKQLGYPIHGMVYNTLRTQRNKSEMQMSDRFSRTLIAKTDAELNQLAVDAYLDMQNATVRLNKFAKEQQDAPRHFNTDTCRWRCPYTEACSYGARGGRGGTRLYLAETGFAQDFTRH